jgi:hypothetical protein
VKGTENISRPVNQYQSAFFTHIALQFKKAGPKAGQDIGRLHRHKWHFNRHCAPVKTVVGQTVIWPKSLFGRRNKCARTIRARHLAIGAKRQPYLRMSKRTTTTITGHPRLVCDNYI